MKKIIPCALLAAMAASVGAHADTTYFFDGVFGETSQKNSIDGYDAISTTENSRGIRTGFYLNRVLGVEFVKMDYGEGKDSFVNLSSNTITNTLDTGWTGVGLQGAISLGHMTKLVGRIGMAAWETKFTEADSSAPGILYKDKDQGVDAYVGLGLRFDVEDNVRIAVEYENMNFSATIGAAETDHNIHSVGISLGVLF